jgi:DNA-binding NarL/FixJ family response regulator
MNGRVPVYLLAADPLTRAGLCAELRARPELLLVEADEVDPSTVGMLAVDTVDERSLAMLRQVQAAGCGRVVLVVNTLNDTDLMAAVEYGVCGVVWRTEATASRLAQLVLNAASGEGALPADLLGRLLKQISRLQRTVLAPKGLNLTGLSARETDVLRLVADGLATRDIARTLAYSERTVTNILHDITTRFQLENRSHAVAYALRQGLI